MLGKLKHEVLKRLRSAANSAGYDIRRCEKHCWPDQQALLKETEVMEIADVGASTGDIARRYYEMFPRARIHCFEPIPEAWATSQQRLADPSIFCLNQLALSDVAGSREFHLNEAPDTSSLLAGDIGAAPASYSALLSTKRVIDVTTERLDTYCNELGIHRLDILKMDVQGGELDVLKGAGKLISEQQVQLIYTEVFFVPFYSGQPLFSDISSMLAGHGYALHGMYNTAYNGHTGRLQWADCIFVAPQLAGLSRDLLRRSMRNESSR